jgi:hypothetical protein
MLSSFFCINTRTWPLPTAANELHQRPWQQADRQGAASRNPGVRGVTSFIMGMSGVYMQWLLLRIKTQLHECVPIFSSEHRIPQSTGFNAAGDKSRHRKLGRCEAASID